MLYIIISNFVNFGKKIKKNKKTQEIILNISIYYFWDVTQFNIKLHAVS